MYNELSWTSDSQKAATDAFVMNGELMSKATNAFPLEPKSALHQASVQWSLVLLLMLLL